MCNPACIEFARDWLRPEEIRERTVLEVGAYDVNCSVRPFVAGLGPRSYVGVDLTDGPGVDEVCEVTRLVERFGAQQFDVVLSTEMLEHVGDRRGAISNMKRVLKPGGILLLTTRSEGFPYHGYPFDFWRFSPNDMQLVFSDMRVDALTADPSEPGVFVRAVKDAHTERDLSDLALYSIVTNRRCTEISDVDLLVFRLRYTTREHFLQLRDTTHEHFRCFRSRSWRYLL